MSALGYIIRSYDQEKLYLTGKFTTDVTDVVPNVARTAGRVARRSVIDGSPTIHVLEFRPREIKDFKRIYNYLKSKAWGPEEIFLEFYNGVRTYYPLIESDQNLGGLENRQNYRLVLEEV